MVKKTALVVSSGGDDWQGDSDWQGQVEGNDNTPSLDLGKGYTMS